MKKFLLSFVGLFCLLFTLSAESITITVRVPADMVDAYGDLYIYNDYYTDSWPGNLMTHLGNNVYQYTFTDELVDPEEDEELESVDCTFSFMNDYYTEEITGITSSSCFELLPYDEEEDYYVPYRVIDCEELDVPVVTYDDPLQQAVVHELASVDTVIFINDNRYPWEYKNGYICSTNKSVNRSKSELSFTYSSSYQTQVQFTWINYYTSNHKLQCYVDGVYKAENTSTSASSQQFFLPAGTHVITFRDSVYSTGSYNRTSGVNAIRVFEVRPLESVVLAEGSMPLTFQNETAHPWIILDDGSIRNGNYWYKSSTSSFSTSFTITEATMLSFDCISKIDDNTSNTDTYYHKLTTYINDNVMWCENGLTSFTHRAVLLEPGTYTVRWEDYIGTSYDKSTSRIKNISLGSNWTEVELDYAGTLGVEVLYKFNVLTDVHLLKVKGNMNATDWATVKKMTELVGLDLSEASFTSLPARQFQNRQTLNYLVLPEGLKTIGNYAFDNTHLLSLHIPSTVTSIGDYAFQQTPWLNEVTFANNSKLQSIGEYCFYESGLKSIMMPNSVTTIGENCFDDCSSLTTLVFSDNITSLPAELCKNTTQLLNLHLPQNLVEIGEWCFYKAKELRTLNIPESVRSIDYYGFANCSSLDTLKLPIKLEYLGASAFADCSSLKYVELPSSAAVGYDDTFDGCTAIRTIDCPSATPPAIQEDPFSDVGSKSNVTLKVPSVSIVAYKLDSYWYQFGNIVEGRDPAFWNICDNLMLTNNRRITGKPDITISCGGSMIVGGAAPMPIGIFELNCSFTDNAAFVNICPNVTADSAYVNYVVDEDDADEWYFISPIYDVDLMNTTHSEGGQFVFRQYNSSARASRGTGNSWRNVSDGILHHGKGYIFQTNAEGVMHMPALNGTDSLILRYEDVEVTLQTYPSSNVANENWNFIGNPYPAYYDIWYMDFTAPITVWNGSTYKAYSLADDNYALRPMEAFFVQKPDVVDRIIFRKEGRQTSTSISHSNTEEVRRRMAKQSADRKVYNLVLTSSMGMSDETRVVINNLASLDYELTCDAAKFMSFNSDCPQLYTIDPAGTRMAINERPLANGIVALGVTLPAVGEYTFDAVSLPDIMLIDSQLGISHNLHDAPYTFSSDQVGEINTRFSLLFGQRPVMTDLDNIESLNENTGCYVYTLDGKLIAYVSAASELQSLNLPFGVYVTRSGNEYSKIVIR